MLLHSAKYQQALRCYQARRIQGRDLKVGNLVLRLRQSNPAMGRAVHRHPSAKARDLQAHQREGQNPHQRLEHRTTTSFLPLNFQALYTFVGVLDRRALNQLVNLYCMFPIPDGDAKRHKAYTGSGNRRPTSSLRDRSYIPCTGVLVVGGYKLGERGS